MDIGKKLVNGFIGFWVYAYVGMAISLIVMFLIHLIKEILSRVWL